MKKGSLLMLIGAILVYGLAGFLNYRAYQNQPGPPTTPEAIAISTQMSAVKSEVDRAGLKKDKEYTMIEVPVINKLKRTKGMIPIFFENSVLREFKFDFHSYEWPGPIRFKVDLLPTPLSDTWSLRFNFYSGKYYIGANVMEIGKPRIQAWDHRQSLNEVPDRIVVELSSGGTDIE